MLGVDIENSASVYSFKWFETSLKQFSLEIKSYSPFLEMTLLTVR